MRIIYWSSDVCSSDLLVHHARARRYRLVFDVARSELRLTLPRRGNSAKALRWAAGQQDWLLAQLGKAALPIVVGPGAAVPLFGIERRIDWNPARPDRKSVVSGKSVYVRVDLGGRRIIQQKNTNTNNTQQNTNSMTANHEPT